MPSRRVLEKCKKRVVCVLMCVNNFCIGFYQNKIDFSLEKTRIYIKDDDEYYHDGNYDYESDDSIERTHHLVSGRNGHQYRKALLRGMRQVLCRAG